MTVHVLAELNEFIAIEGAKASRDEHDDDDDDTTGSKKNLKKRIKKKTVPPDHAEQQTLFEHSDRPASESAMPVEEASKPS